MNELLQEWITEYDGIDDKRLTWELLKYEIRKFTCRYCADKKKAERLEEQLLQTRLDELEEDLGTVPGNEISEEYYTCKARILELEELKAKGAIIRSKVKWLEEGEKSTQYFFSLEKYNYSKKNIRKLEALRERRPPWPRQIITLILPTVEMLSLGCERLPTP